MLLLLLGGCAEAVLAPKYLSRCPADGPESAADLGLRRIPVDLGGFYDEVSARSAAFELSELGVASHDGVDYPILAIRRRGASAGRKILVVAGVHGNETAGLLAVPAMLDLLASDRPELRSSDVTVVAPANPVGVANGSRYNGNGCDVNRDFVEPTTYEARVMRDFIVAESPALIVALHEGPQDGFMLVATSAARVPPAEAAVRAVEQRGIALASTHFAGLSLGTPGISAEGAGMDFLKWAIRLGSLGSFAKDQGIGTYTTETSWSSEDFDERIVAHVIALEAVLLAF